MTETDAHGAFGFDRVPDAYDLSMVVHFTAGVRQTHAYLYQGLRRRDPSLQVFRGLDDRVAKLETPLSESQAQVIDGRVLGVAMAGPDGVFERRYASPGGASLNVTWVGPATMAVSAHALSWKNEATLGIPEGYFAYASTALDLVSGNSAPLVLTSPSVRAPSRPPRSREPSLGSKRRSPQQHAIAALRYGRHLAAGQPNASDRRVQLPRACHRRNHARRRRRRRLRKCCTQLCYRA